MQRLRSQSSARGAGLIMAACLALACGDAQAQNAPPYPDPFAPQLETNPRNPPRFQKAAPGAPARPEQLRTFTPVPSGAGTTGFDATNAPKKLPPKPRPGAAATAQPLQAGAAQQQ